MPKIKNVYFEPQAQLLRESIRQLSSSEAEFEPLGALMRVRVPGKRLDFAVAMNTVTIEYEWAEAPKQPEEPKGSVSSGKFKPEGAR